MGMCPLFPMPACRANGGHGDPRKKRWVVHQKPGYLGGSLGWCLGLVGPTACGEGRPQCAVYRSVSG